MCVGGVSHLTRGMIFGTFAQFVTRQTAGNELFILEILSIVYLDVSACAMECMRSELFMQWATGLRIFMEN